MTNIWLSIYLLERRLDDLNYESLTESTKRKDSVSTDKTADTNINSDNDTVNDNANNILNERIQSTSGDRNGLQTINYGDGNQKIDLSNRIILANKKPIYKSCKDACSNNIITHGSNNITHEGNIITHGNNPSIYSE